MGVFDDSETLDYVTTDSVTFRNYLHAIDASISRIDPAMLANDTNGIAKIFDSISNFVLSDLATRYPVIANDSNVNRTGIDTSYKLIESALGTTKSAGQLIFGFLKEQGLTFETEEELTIAIKPFIRDLLDFNLSFISLLTAFADRNYFEGIALNSKGQLCISGPSYLYTAFELSQIFKDETKIRGFQLMFDSIVGNIKTARLKMEVQTLIESIAGVILSNPLDLAKRLYGAFLNSRFKGNETLGDVIQITSQCFNNAAHGIKGVIIRSGITNNHLTSNLEISSIVTENLLGILNDSPLLDELIFLKNSGRLYPTIFDVESVTKTIGCPAYFHNIAIKYVVKGVRAAQLQDAKKP